MSPEAKAVFWILLAALLLGVMGAVTMWRVHQNEILPQERRQFLDL